MNKVEAVIARLRIFLKQKEKHTDLAVLNRIDDMYYLEKIEELTLLDEEYSQVSKRAMRLRDLLKGTCAQVTGQLNKDLEWLSAYRKSKHKIGRVP